MAVRWPARRAETSNISSLTDLSDIGTAAVTNRFVLLANGTSYVGRALVEADISNLQAYLTAETNDLSAAVTWANVPSANITLASVNQHLAAVSKRSIVVDSLELMLSGDLASPGNDQVYGTNGSGVKGWKADPSGGSPFATPLRVLADITTPTPPVAANAPTARLEWFDSDESDLLAHIGFQASSTLRMENHMHGGAIIFSAENNGGTLQTLIVGTPGSAVSLYFNGLLQMSTLSTGIHLNLGKVVRWEGTTVGEFAEISVDSANNAVKMITTGMTTGVLRGWWFEQPVRLRSNTDLFFYDPDNANPVRFTHNNTDFNIVTAGGGAGTRNFAVSGLTGRMTDNTFPLQQTRVTTTAAVEAIGNAINTSDDKIAGYRLFNTTTNQPIWALGPNANSLWVDATGTTAHTPIA